MFKVGDKVRIGTLANGNEPPFAEGVIVEILPDMYRVDPLDGNNPITLTQSRAKLELPNCVRFRRDGTNEVSGIVPDVSTGVRWNDGPTYAGRLSMSRLPEAVERADALYARKK